MVPVPGLDGLYVLQDIDAGTRRLRCPGAVARTVADRGAAPSYITLMGAVRKAVGGPEPVRADGELCSSWARRSATRGPTS